MYNLLYSILTFCLHGTQHPRQRVAMKIAAKKTAQGYLVSDKRCDLCEMPLFSMNGNSMCKVCPAIEKWARKRETGVARNKAEITVELTESCDNYFFDDTPKQFITTDNVESDNKGCAQRLGVKSGDDTANPEVINTESLVNESKVSSSPNPVECGHSHHRSDDIVNQDLNRGTDENLKDILSPCSVLTSKCNSFEVSMYVCHSYLVCILIFEF